MIIRVAGKMNFALLLPGDVFTISGCDEYYIKVNATDEHEPNALNLSDNCMYTFSEDCNIFYKPSVLTVGGVRV